MKLLVVALMAALLALPLAVAEDPSIAANEDTISMFASKDVVFELEGGPLSVKDFMDKLNTLLTQNSDLVQKNSDLTDQVTDLTSRLSTLEAATLIARVKALEDTTLPTLSSRVTTLEQSDVPTRVQTLEAATVPGVAARVLTLEQSDVPTRVSTLENKQTNMNVIVTKLDNADLPDRVKTLEDTTVPDVSGRVNTLEQGNFGQRITDLTGRVTDVETAIGGGSSLSSRLATVESAQQSTSSILGGVVPRIHSVALVAGKAASTADEALKAPEAFAHFPLQYDGEAARNGVPPPSEVTAVTFEEDGPGGIVTRSAKFSVSSTSGIRYSDGATDFYDLNYLTFAAWIKPTSCASDHCIIMNSENRYEIALFPTSTAGVYTFQDALGPCWRWAGDLTVKQNEWVHVALTYGADGKERHFINGQLLRTYTCSGGSGLPTSSNDFKIGARGSGTDNSASFTGHIADVFFFKRDLNALEVSELYRRGISHPADAAVGHWGVTSEPKLLQDHDFPSTVDAGVLVSEGPWLGRGSMKFSGSNAVVVSESQSGHPLDLSVVTLAAWIKPIQCVGVDVFLGKEGSYLAAVVASGGKCVLRDAMHPGCWRWWGNAEVPVNEWSHVAVTYDGSMERHYVNGKLVESNTCNNADELQLSQNNNLFKIGARSSNNNENFVGFVSEVYVLDYAASEEVISVLANN